MIISLMSIAFENIAHIYKNNFQFKSLFDEKIMFHNV